MNCQKNGKYLIINADDFGIESSTNNAISELFEKGLISSASLMTVAPYSKQAIDIAAANNLPVGLHLTINSDDNINRWHSNSSAKSLNDDMGLYYSQAKLALHAKSRDVTDELEAQYQFMVQNGLKPDHADNHCGTLCGVNGRLFFINAFRFCKKYDLPFRFPKKKEFISRQFGGKTPLPLIIAHNILVNAAKHYEIKMLDDMFSNPYSIKKIKSYEVLRDYYCTEMKNISSGITEMFLHPSYSIDNNTSGNENEWLKREYELKLLLSGDLIEIAEMQNISVVSWKNAPFKSN